MSGDEEQVEGPVVVSRRRLMAMAGGTGALAAFLAACGSDSDSDSTDTSAASEAAPVDTSETEQFGRGDVGILNYALTLEHLEAAFYDDVIKSGLFKGGELGQLELFGEEESEHVTALTAAVKQLGAEPAARPKTRFPLASAEAVLKLAATLENIGAAAYLGQVTKFESPELLGTALTIHSVEGRHAAVFNLKLGRSITPDGAFAKPADAKTVLKSVEPFIVG